MANIPAQRLPQTSEPGGILSLIEDTTPQLGGNLDVNAFGITNLVKLSNGAWTAKTISGDAITADKMFMTLAGEGAAADDLATITHSSGVDWVVLRIEDDANNITLKHNTGNIFMLSAADLELTDTEIIVLAIWNPDDSKWGVIAGGGGGISNVVEDTTPQLGGTLDCNSKGIDNIVSLGLGSWVTETISGGTISGDESLIIVAGEGAAADDLDTITHQDGVDIVYLRATDDNDITIKHGTGNIHIIGSSDVALANDEEMAMAVWNPDDSVWGLIAGGGGGGGGTDANAIHDNVAGEILAIAQDTAPIETHELLAENAAGTKKAIPMGYIPVTDWMRLAGESVQRTIVGKYQGTTKEDKTIYVDVASSDDTGTGEVGDKLKTIQKAIDLVSPLIIAHDIIIDIADGTYAENVEIGPLVFACGSLTITGNTTTPGNVVIDPGAGNYGFDITDSILTLQGLKVTGATLRGLRIMAGSNITMDRCEVISNDDHGIDIFDSVLSFYGNSSTTAKINSNGDRGINATNSTIYIGIDTQPYTEVNSNTSYGIRLQAHSIGLIFSVEIGGNGSHGLLIDRFSYGQLYQLTNGGSSNTGDGVKCEQFSSAYLYGSVANPLEGDGLTPSSGTSLVNNADTSAIYDNT